MKNLSVQKNIRQNILLVIALFLIALSFRLWDLNATGGTWDERPLFLAGRGRAMDNVFSERLWRSVKYEEVYLNDYATVSEARQGIGNYIEFYNQERPHQSLSYKTPAEVYFWYR